MSGAGVRMEPQTSSLFSLLLLLLLPPPSLFYSLKNCTIDFYDQGYIACDLIRLTTIPTGIPKSATSLSLFSNRIQRIKQTDLAGFTRLTFLNLGSNDISHIEDGTFSDLSSLTEIILSYNKFPNLTNNMFRGLSNLSLLNLIANDIVWISKVAFEPLKNLEELYLSQNTLVQIGDTFLQHPFLWKLDLRENPVISFDSNNFQFPLLNLKEIRFYSTTLKKFSIQSNVLPHLKLLDLSGVESEFEWDVSEKSFLGSLSSLYLNRTRLILDEYKLIFQTVDSVESLLLRGIGRLFDKGLLDFACRIPALKKLDIGENGIFALNHTLLQSCTNLTELDLSKNMLTDITEASFRMLTHLTQLSVEENQLAKIPSTIRNMTSLTHLSFFANHITEIRCSDLANLSSLTELNLGANHISQLSSCVFKELQSLKVLHLESNLFSQINNEFGSSLTHLNINENHVQWLYADAFANMSSLIDLKLESTCPTIVQRGAFSGLINLKDLTYAPFSDSIGILSGLPRLEKLTMYLWKNRAFSKLTNNQQLAECPSLKELTISVDSDTCYPFTRSLLRGLKQLQVVSFERYCCNQPQSNIFSHNSKIVNLKFIHCVDFNLDPELFRPLTELTILEVSRSSVRSLDFLINANLTKLEKLILTNNELTVINETVFEGLSSLKYLDLSDNPFVCDCSNNWFIEWAIRNKQVQVANAFQYRCSSPLSEEEHFLLDFNVQSCWEFTGFLCFISTSALVLLTLLSSFIYHLLRWQLVYGYYLLLAFLYDSKKRRQGCPHIYDAFVSYNVHDEEWVYRELVPELEGRQGWRLCLHHRDFLPGKPIIENITDAIYSSRKTLCVISRRYLQSEWCSREIQLASFRLFDERKDVLILLFLEEISSNQLSPFYRMRKLVKSRTYLSWAQARSHKGLFWEKVRRALESGNEPGDNNNPLTANV